MIFRLILKWLDSDFVYEFSFSIVRLLLLDFFIKLMRFEGVRDMGIIVFEFSERLLVDFLSMC